MCLLLWGGVLGELGVAEFGELPPDALEKVVFDKVVLSIVEPD